MKRCARRQQGYVLIVALFVLIVLMSAAALIASSLAYRMWSFRQEVQAVRLTALLDGGLAKALPNLWANPHWSGIEAEPFGDGTITIEVRPEEEPYVEVVVKASYWGARRAARAKVELDEDEDDPSKEPKAPKVKLWEPVSFEY